VSDLASPQRFSPDLTGERLSVVGELMLDVLSKGIAATNTPLDCAYTRAVLPWGWIRNALRLMAQSRQHEWLSLKHAGNDLVIAIGEIPIRFFIDDHINPRKQRVLSPTEGEQAQLTFNFAQRTDDQPALWRFIVERAATEDGENRVFFVGYNKVGEIIAKWEFTESVRAFRSTDSDIPAPAELDPIALAPIYPSSQDAEQLANGFDGGNSDDERRAG
jgi:hypothetical protein